MTDIVDSKTRSRMMSGIKSKNTKPELLVRRYLHKAGFRYRIHVNNLPGNPDIVMPKYKLAIFVHGCFWHRHKDCKLASSPAQNASKWNEKFLRNIERDKNNIAILLELGWRVVVIWECSIRLSNNDFSWLKEHVKFGSEKYFEWPTKLG